MGRVLEVSFGFPTVIFTTLLMISVGYWLLTTLLGGGGDGLDLDLDLDVDLDLDLDLESDVGTGLSGLLRTFHLHHIPLSLTFTFLSLFGWAISVIATSLTIESGSASVLPAVGIFLAALLISGFLTGRIGQALQPVFASNPALGRDDLIGRICTVQTGSVSGTFGQAEVVDSEAGSHLIQVRCEPKNALRKGSLALIVTVDDDGLFQISPDVEAIT